MADKPFDMAQALAMAEKLKPGREIVPGLMDSISDMAHRDKNSAIDIFDGLKKYIKEFQSELDDEHEILLCLPSFGAETVFHAERISFFEPNLITFYGETSDRKKVQLIQHVTQLNVLLKAVAKLGDAAMRIH